VRRAAIACSAPRAAAFAAGLRPTQNTNAVVDLCVCGSTGIRLGASAASTLHDNRRPGGGRADTQRVLHTTRRLRVNKNLLQQYHHAAAQTAQ